jgi:hypothetical protein
MMRALWVLPLTVAIAAATWAGGWSAVPLIAFLWGAWRRSEDGAALAAGLAGALAWGVLLGVAAVGAPVLTVAERMGGLAGVPGLAIVLLMLLFAFGLGWSAAVLGRALMQLALRGRAAE